MDIPIKDLTIQISEKIVFTQRKNDFFKVLITKYLYSIAKYL